MKSYEKNLVNVSFKENLQKFAGSNEKLVAEKEVATATKAVARQEKRLAKESKNKNVLSLQAKYFAKGLHL